MFITFCYPHEECKRAITIAVVIVGRAITLCGTIQKKPLSNVHTTPIQKIKQRY